MTEAQIRAEERKKALSLVEMLLCANTEDEANILLPGLQFAYDKMVELASCGQALPDALAKPKRFYVIAFCARRWFGWRGSATWTIAGSRGEAMQFGLAYARKHFPATKGWRRHAAIPTAVDPAYVQQAYHAQRGE